MVTSKKTLDLIEKLRTSGQSFCIATVLRTADSTSARAGAKAVITPDGDLHGFVGGGCVTGAVRRAALESLEEGEPQMIRVKPKDEVVTTTDVDGVTLHKSSCPSGGTVDIFLEPMKASRILLICGASPIAQAILSVAQCLDAHLIVAASKEDHEKMPGAALYLEGFDIEELNLGDQDAAIVATQGKRDRDALRSVVGSGAGYKGMVCSRRKLANLTAELLAENVALKSQFKDLYAPAGLNIGAIEPEEIGLSVITEIIAHRRQGKINSFLPNTEKKGAAG
ncbi:MAG: XdhC family protein [Proteobacteria bacterium]|nr:XdhC family protein [Pseudomonadota bacterium]